MEAQQRAAQAQQSQALAQQTAQQATPEAKAGREDFLNLPSVSIPGLSLPSTTPTMDSLSGPAAGQAPKKRKEPEATAAPAPEPKRTRMSRWEKALAGLQTELNAAADESLASFVSKLEGSPHLLTSTETGAVARALIKRHKRNPAAPMPQKGGPGWDSFLRTARSNRMV